MTYKIKPLEWHRTGELMWEAPRPMDGRFTYLVSFAIKDDHKYWYSHATRTEHKTEEEAIGATEKYHEQQLMKWLEPVCHICEGNDSDGRQVNCPIHDDISKMKIYGNTFHEHAPVGRITPNAMTKQRVKTIQEAFGYYLDKKKDKPHD